MKHQPGGGQPCREFLLFPEATRLRQRPEATAYFWQRASWLRARGLVPEIHRRAHGAQAPGRGHELVLGTRGTGSGGGEQARECHFGDGSSSSWLCFGRAGCGRGWEKVEACCA